MQVTAIISALGTLTLAIYSYRALRNARSGPSADAHMPTSSRARSPNQPPSEMRTRDGR